MIRDGNPVIASSTHREAGVDANLEAFGLSTVNESIEGVDFIIRANTDLK
jgi:hypothetical protein